MTRPGQIALLVVPTMRDTLWLPIVGAGLLGFGVVSLDGPQAVELRLAAIALAVAAAFALDDSAGEALAPAPTPLLIRRLVRVAVVVPLPAVIWIALVSYSDVAGATGLRMTLELVAMVALTWAFAAALGGSPASDRGGVAAGPVVLVLLGAAAVALPEQWSMFAAGPEDPRWTSAGRRWGVVLTLALAGFLLASRDPFTRHRLTARAGAASARLLRSPH